MATLFKETDTGALVWRDDIPGLSVCPPVWRNGRTQVFGQVSITGILHNGIDQDIDNWLGDRDAGREIRAMLGGRVVFREDIGQKMPGLAWDGSTGGYGKQVYIDSPGGFHARYAHFREIIVSEGEEVRKGQLLGWGDDTGISEGDHHHGELWYYGDRFDWWPYVDWNFDPDNIEEDDYIMALSPERRQALDRLIDSEVRGEVVHMDTANKTRLITLVAPTTHKLLIGLAAKADTLLDLPGIKRTQWVQLSNNLVPLALLGRVMRDVGFTEDLAEARRIVRKRLKELMEGTD